jgi:hypothetical protein
VTVAGGRRASGKDVRERNRKFGSEAACGSRQMQSLRAHWEDTSSPSSDS